MTTHHTFVDTRDIPGMIVLPDDPTWDEARQAWNKAIDQHPAAVALPRSAEDVRALIDYARQQGLRVAAQGTGHNAGPLGPLADTVLVKTEAMRGVQVDPAAGTMRVEAGVWVEVVEAAARHGLAALAGSSPNVGVAGYILGGGMGWLGRCYGLSCNNVGAIEVVTVDGRLLRVDAGTEPDLFWALRGGGAASAWSPISNCGSSRSARSMPASCGGRSSVAPPGSPANRQPSVRKQRTVTMIERPTSASAGRR